MNKYYITMMLIAGIFAADIKRGECNNSSNEFDLNISVESNKQTYIIGKPIIITIRLINNSEKGPKLPSDMLPQLLHVIDQDGIIYHKIVNASFREIAPMKKGQICESKIDISTEYGSMYRKEYDFLPVGNYTIYFYYKVREGYEIKSEKLRIQIIYPSEQEQTIFELLNEGIRISFSNDMKRKSKADSIYNNIIKNYPNSIYRENAIVFKIYNYYYSKIKENREISFEASKLLLNEYPQNYYRTSAINYIHNYYTINNKLDECEKYFNELLTKEKDETFKKIINQKLEEIIKAKSI